MSPRIARVLAPALVLALLFPIASASRAAVEPTTQPVGTITGKVVKEDGTGAVGVEVRIMAAPLGGKKANKGAKGEKPTLASAPHATTDADGKFTIAVPPGSYNVVVRSGKKGDVLLGTEKVTVTDGQTSDVTVTLKKREPKK